MEQAAFAWWQSLVLAVILVTSAIVMKMKIRGDGSK